MFKKRDQADFQGFTLIELVTTIAIIAILATIAYISLNPGKRQREARNSKRWADVNSILNAIARYQMDNAGVGTLFNDFVDDGIYILGAATDDGCGLNCRLSITAETSCKNLFNDLDDYLAKMPVDPLGGDSSIETTNGWNDDRTGYWIKYNSTSGRVDIGSCEPEDPEEGADYPEIKVTLL